MRATSCGAMRRWPRKARSKSLSTNRFRLPTGPRPISMNGCRECASFMSIPSMIGRASMQAKGGGAAAGGRGEATVYVREMAASHVPPVVRAWHAMSAWMVRGFQVVIDDDDLATLRALDRDNALIFLISHRSYLDQFSFPPRLTQGGIAPTFGLAGANLNFFRSE